VEEQQKNWVEVLHDEVAMGDGCATFLAYLSVLVAFALLVYGLWVLFTAP
jgi:hypothetical protein